MAYTPNTWASGDTITAAKLNRLEMGVGGINVSYTPHTWQTGDTITAALLNALEQGVADGGSELSTVSMTLTAIGYPGCEPGAAYVSEGHIFNLSEGFVPDSTEAYDLIVISGSITFAFYTVAPITTYSGGITLGTAEYDGETYMTPVTITGNCSLTLTGWTD